MKNLVTIFTPTYNRAELLSKLYNSLVKQTNKNFEWVIVDDGSIDNTSEIVKEFISEQKIKINYYKQKNSGKHIAINKGVEIAQGELFFIVDSDDYILPHAVGFILDKYEKIKDDQSVGGLSARRGYNINQVIGSDNFSNFIITDVFKFRYEHYIQGDMAEVVKTSVLKKFPFPQISDEKFCPESLIWNRIGVKYKFLWLPDIIYIGEYLEGGLTDNIFKIRKKSPDSTILFYKELQEMPIPFVQKVRANINYWRFAKFSKKKFYDKWSNTNPLLSLIGLPLSLIFLIKDAK
ncbi:glycosyltransferase family 2 protein [Chryseobacterium bernardetii]|uniref:glycosyltransferase family 2 protein n=1 Tax=Chryseobacterium bernardetii TaxID=1241978 RepID=UPI000F4F57A9|nr:glycosyltransferase family 2 protein [Chryseobacterium bernardetii]AZB33867.1 glycosyltransferase family 2 protein [Chryseobacterium bernardetii]